MRITVKRTTTVPNPLTLARFLKAPELGPRVLFFTGGTALRDLSTLLLRYTYNSIHLITPFDSGGSSAQLRKSFGMLAVGDLRNRLMALADRSLHGNPEIYALFAHRLPKNSPPSALRAELDSFIQAEHPLAAAVPEPMREIIRAHLFFFRRDMPEDFDLRGASIGNLILAGGFFNHNRRIDPVIYMFSRLVEARGLVKPIVNADLTLAAELVDGTVLAGQHLITGKEGAPLSCPIKRVFLCRSQDDPTPVNIPVNDRVRELVASAELVCYPMGSFYSSVVANLLPKGVGDALSRVACPKVFIPNPAGDPEQLSLGLGESVRRLLHYLRESCTEPTPIDALLNFILLDQDDATYQSPLDLGQIEAMGVTVIRGDLKGHRTNPLFDSQRVIEHLLSLA
ncbi:GAK system CofD-like protein [Fundidesulfovibrio butyratiphilus]